MSKAQILIDEIGDEALKAIGMTARNLRHVTSCGVIPAKWYAAIKLLADQRGIECPLCAFSFHAAENKK
jgi:hypothetical protein